MLKNMINPTRIYEKVRVYVLLVNDSFSISSIMLYKENPKICVRFILKIMNARTVIIPATIREIENSLKLFFKLPLVNVKAINKKVDVSHFDYSLILQIDFIF